MIRRIYTARKSYKCQWCGKEICKGSEYESFIVPPWENYEADVDDDTGRTIGYLLPEDQRKWITDRYHLDCTYEMLY